MESHSHHFSTAAAAAIFLVIMFSTVSGHPNSLQPNISFSGWDSFKNLTGCHVGEHVTGLASLKRYLNHFGYMDFRNVTDDDFDDYLESAIKTYQLNFHLNPTGILDIPTVNQIVRPRCGVPDIINGTTSMNSSGAGRANERRLYTFFPGAPKWPSDKRQLTYAFSPDNQVVDGQILRSVFSRAFNRWAAVTQLTFTESAVYRTADIRIGFFSGDHGDGEPFDGVLGTLAHAFSPPNGRLHLDAAENWVAGDGGATRSSAGIDLESVAVHEIGHLLGLGHSSVEEAIMFPTIVSGTRRVELASDDIAGVQELYGANPNFNGSSSSTPTSTQEERERSGNSGVRVRVKMGLGFYAAVVSAIVLFIL